MVLRSTVVVPKIWHAKNAQTFQTLIFGGFAHPKPLSAVDVIRHYKLFGEITLF